MDRRQIALKLTLDALGIPFSMKTFNDRLILQKVVYLAEEAGVHLGYSFGWYLRGPYAPALTRDAFAIAADLPEGDEGDESQGWSLDEKSQASLSEVAKLIPSGTRAKRATELELLASLHFLVANFLARPDAEELTKKLGDLDKPYELEEVKAGMRKLTEHGLLKDE